MFKDKITTILGKAMDISENTEVDVFVDYAPHCKSIDVRVFNNGWSYNLKPDASFTVYYDVDGSFRTEEKIHTKLDEIINKLDSMSQTLGVL